MKKNLLLILLGITCFASKAQNCFWAKSMGGTYDEVGISIAIDDSGNVYTTGYFRGTVDFDPGPLVNNLSSGWYAAFITKMDNSGNLLWAKSIGTLNTVIGNSIALDNSGNVYIIGSFQNSSDFDPGSGTDTLTAVGSYDIFVCKLNSAGDFLWARSMGGPNADQGMSIATDGMGSVYISGAFQGTCDFDPDATSHNITAAGPNDIYIAKLDSTGNFVWAKSIGSAGNNNDICRITADSSGNVYATGRFMGTTDFDPGALVNNLISAGAQDIFVAKFNSAGDYVWARSMGEINDEYGASISVDASGNVYTTGTFQGTLDFNPGAGTNNLSALPAGTSDIFLSKLDSTGTFVWAKSIGGSSDDAGSSVATDIHNNVYVTGYFRNTADFNPGSGTFDLTSAGMTDIFITKLGSDGSFLWAKQMGGADDDWIESIAIDINSNVYSTGRYNATCDFDPSSGVYDLTSLGATDIFVNKLNDPLLASISSQINVDCFGASNGSAIALGTGGALPYIYSWNTSPVQTNDTAVSLPAGNYTVTITENAGCSQTASVVITEPAAESALICMVTVDSLSQHNIIVWDKTSLVDVDSFIVYREISTNNYQPIAAVSFDSLSEFVDTVRTRYFPNTGNPNEGTYRYKIAAKNSCGNSGPKSPYHNTIYLLNSGGTFYWTQLYTIEGGANPVANYVLMRDNLSNGTWTTVTSVAGSQQTINDPLYTIYQSTATWKVETQWSITCSPTRSFSTSVSNKYSNVVTKVDENSLEQSVSIFPNPSAGKFTFLYKSSELKNLQFNIEVYNVLGEKIYDQLKDSNDFDIDLADQTKGVYFIKVKTGEELFTSRLVIQ
jgi:hypothetical protein